MFSQLTINSLKLKCLFKHCLTTIICISFEAESKHKMRIASNCNIHLCTSILHNLC